jgi:transcription elongation factor GreA
VNEIKDRLSTELKALEREFRVDLPKEIKTAVAMGDLRENAEYHAALERQRFVKARIGQLRERLASINSINLRQLPHDRVGLGSKVTLLDLDNDAEKKYVLVFPEVADLSRGLISIASPIGQSLVGKREGAEVTIRTPSGERRFELLELVTVHGKDGSDGE